MAEGSTRRLPKWLAIGDDDKKTEARKKKKVEENKLRQEPENNPTPPRKSVSLAKKETKRKRGDLFKHSESPDTAVNKRKREGNYVAFGTQEEIGAITLTQDHIPGDDDLTVDDLVSIAQEYVKDSEDSEKSLVSSRNGQASSTNEQQFSQASTGSTLSSINFRRTDDPAQDMLHLFLGPWL